MSEITILQFSPIPAFFCCGWVKSTTCEVHFCQQYLAHLTLHSYYWCIPSHPNTWTSLNNLLPLILLIRVNLGPFWDLLGYPEATLRTLVLLRANMSLNLLTSQPHFVSQIYLPPNITQKWFYIQNLQRGLSFQEKRTVCKSVTWRTSNTNSQETPCIIQSIRY